MKKWLRFLIVFLLSLGLVACNALSSQMPIERTIDSTKEDGSGATEDGKREGIEESLESFGLTEIETETRTEENELEIEGELAEEGVYTSKEEVAKYLFLYGHLPSNYITKKEAEQLGWKGGSLEPFAPGMCIGGSRFGNYEGLLPEKEGRFYTECDIDTLGADKRGAKRIVFSNDGLIYYTEDHYQSFELLYGEE